MREKIACPHNWPGDQLRKKRNGEHEIAQRLCGPQHSTINIERIRQRVKRVKGNADRQKNVEMWGMIDDADARKQPLEILE